MHTTEISSAEYFFFKTATGGQITLQTDTPPRTADVYYATALDVNR